MIKSTEIPKKDDQNESRYSLNLDIEQKDKTNELFTTQTSFKVCRPRSAKPLLLRKYIPKLKPSKPHLNPNVMYLGGMEEYYNFRNNKNNLFKNKNEINIVAEEDYEKTCNSGDEGYNYIFSSKNFNDEDEYCNDENINKIKDNSNNNISIKLKEKGEVGGNKLRRIRKHLLRTKQKMTLKKYNDDTSIVTKVPYKDIFLENYRYNWGCPNENEELFSENISEYEPNFFKKKKSKSIYVGSKIDMNKPPILGFLQMNENSGTNTISSGISEV